ncbi:MAG TPA: gluconate 2-dehydrogenase subunit 3 family protein, partial [Gemmatimonadaceae bacterium]|nr:gluconate 2-dehydrogenase subunit 3 family protein [Gemmatimonadaceae bacterium]
QHDFGEARRLEELKKSKDFLARAVQENAPKTESQQATSASTDPPNRYFRMMKELALLGYFTSEIGCTQAQVYEESPGNWQPCIPYKAGQKAYAGHA